MNSPEKQLKYSIRKVSVGAASVVIGALYLLMGAGIAHAEGVESAREAERAANPTDPEQSGNGETGNKPDLSNTDATASTYNAPVAENPLVAPEAAKPRTRSKRELPDGDTGETPAGNAGTVSEPTSGNEGGSAPADTDSALLDANRKGDVVKDDQPGVRVPKAGEDGSDDKNANLRFDAPGEDATVEEMWKIIQNMPDDFQNNERSYLRNMDTLGDALRFKNGKVSEDADGVKLQDGEIREIDSFGGWRAINKEGHAGKFAIGKKNAQGYFTGWYIDKDGKRQEGGMLGSNALDQIFLHEQALDRRFKYMLMLAKGRTIANKTDQAQDDSPFKIETEKRTGNNLDKLPVKVKEDIIQHSPNLVGFNGIEKTFTAFSTKYGSRLKIDFVTGYISDYEGSKGTYRIVVKAIKKGDTDGATKEETIYDHTINRIDGIVENEERYSQGVDLSGVNRVIKKIFQDEYSKKVTTLANDEYTKKYPGGGKKDTAKLDPLKEEARQELIKKGEVTYELPIDKDKLREEGRNKFKEELNIQAGYTTVANTLNSVLKKINDEEVKRNSPTWDKTSEKTLENPKLEKSKDPDRVYKLLDFILPTAKKIIYHADTDQLELETDPEKVKSHRAELEKRLKAKEAELNTADETKKIELNKEISALKSAIGSTNDYTYTEARNGSKQVKILGSHMEATRKTDEISEAEYNKYRTNALAADEKEGLAKFTGYFVEKNNVTRSEVLADDKLSKEIEKQIGGDQDKLGKGGYFSTGDIPLGKDVVAYKVQVFAENEKRVGVNKQSPRLQYNLPILADFSVIQDTVEPSKEVTTRIITKLKEQGKITEDQEKKIKEEIKKSKKTSELRSQLSGDVKVKYQDVNGTLLTLKNTVTGQKETDLGKKGEDGTYLAVDSGLRYTNYDVTDKKLDTITTSDGKRYRLKRSLADNSLEDGRLKASDAETGTISDSPATVTFVYEEDTTPPAPAEVDATRTVKRTITYVKEDNVNGTIKRTVLEKQTKENTVTFTGKEVTDTEHNTVSYKNWTSTNSKFPKVDTPVLEGYIADIASVGEEEATAPTPTDPKTNIEINYTPDPQKAVVKVYTIRDGVKIELPNEKVSIDSGIPDAAIPSTKLDEKIKDLEKRGYIVDNKTPLKGETFDKVKDSETGDPSQVYELILRERTSVETETKSVTRTIKYYKIDEINGSKVEVDNGKLTNTKTAEFTREVTTNLATGLTTIGAWSDKQTLDEVKTPVLTGYIADKVKVPSSEVTADTESFEEEVVYKKIGSWVPKVPGVENPTPIPYPNDPNDPTKPKYPDYPTTPGNPGETPNPQPDTPGGGTPEKPKTPPVIPYVPGYTPKIGDKPLEPVDPKHPENGYKVPPVPTEPGKDTPIEYVKDGQQKAITSFVDPKGNVLETPITETGDSNTPLTKDGEIKATIAKLKLKGYDVETNTYPP